MIKGNKLVGVTSRVDKKDERSFFTSLQHPEMAGFITEVIARNFKPTPLVKVLTLSVDQSDLDSAEFKKAVSGVRSKYAYIEENKSIISAELASLYKSLKSILAKETMQREHWKALIAERKVVMDAMLVKLSALSARYQKDQPIVFPSLLAYPKPNFAVGAAMNTLNEFYFHAKDLDYSEGNPEGRKRWNLEFLNHYYLSEFDSGRLQGGGGAPTGQPTLAPPTDPNLQVGKILLMENSNSLFDPVIIPDSKSVKILEDIHFANPEQILHGLSRHINDRGMTNRAVIVPYFTLRKRSEPMDAQILDYVTANAMVIKNGKIIEVETLQ